MVGITTGDPYVAILPEFELTRFKGLKAAGEAETVGIQAFADENLMAM
jgi:hypothetical protein